MNHCKPAGGFFELCLPPGGLFVRIDLQQGTVTTVFKDWHSWHWDTGQKRVADNLVHFIEPDGQIVGILCFEGGARHG